MGACTFVDVKRGSSAKDAFEAAVSDAQYEYGHGGYTGTIAEKYTFVMIDPKKDGKNTDDWAQADYEDYAYKLVVDGDYRIDDKWGPAGCIDLGDGKYLFFGWASS